MCKCQFVEEKIWPWDETDLIIWPWDFSVAQYGWTSWCYGDKCLADLVYIILHIDKPVLKYGSYYVDRFEKKPPIIGHVEKGQPCWKNIFTITLQQLTQIYIFVFKYLTLQLVSDRPIYRKMYGKMCVI